MAYFRLEPEVAGELGDGTVMDTSVHPPNVSSLHYEITDWLGDHLLESYPVYLISEQLGHALTQSGLHQFDLRDARVTLSPDAQELLADVDIPKFRWFVVTGTAGRDDIGVTDNTRLVVSDRALEVLRSYPLNNCDVEPYDEA
jgi:hypothetical protein